MKNVRYKITTLIIALVSCFGIARAQEIKGIVFDLESSERLRNVTVKNLNNKQEVETDPEGNFTIAGNINDYLELSGMGYAVDTAFIHDEGVRRIYLVRDQNTILINEVYVTRFTDSRLESEIQRARREGQAVEASQNRGGMRISPSRLFGREGKTARSNLDILLEERDIRKIDKVFTNQLIRSLTPLGEEEITFFRETYRPTLEFIEQANPEDLRIYISESYTEFRKDNPVKH